jgi:hypothetical protein
MRISKYNPTFNPAHILHDHRVFRMRTIATSHYANIKTAVEITIYDTGDTASCVVQINAPAWTRLGSARLSKKSNILDSRTFGSIVFLALKNVGVTGIDRLITDEFDVHDIVLDLSRQLGYKDAEVTQD